MRQIAFNLYYEAKRNLESMRKSNMTLCERIKYEKALVQLDAMRRILETATFN